MEKEQDTMPEGEQLTDRYILGRIETKLDQCLKQQDRIEAQNAVILEQQRHLADEVSDVRERVRKLEEERSVHPHIPRAPSITSEVKGMHDSLRVLGTVNQDQLTILQSMARSPMFTAAATFLGLMAASFVLAMFNSCTAPKGAVTTTPLPIPPVSAAPH